MISLLFLFPSEIGAGMTKLMQNHPHSFEYPVNGRKVVINFIRNHGIGNFLYGYNFLLRMTILTMNIVSVISIAMISVVFILDLSYFLYNFNLILCTLLFLSLFGPFFTVVLFLRNSKLPYKEQEEYYKQAKIGYLELNKRLALRLDIVSTYTNGFWSETLEYYPLISRLKNSTGDFKFLHPTPNEDYLHILYDNWNITDADQYRKCIQALEAGLDSKPFAYLLHPINEEYSGDRVKNLAMLTKLSIPYVESCSQKKDGARVPVLLWGFDLWRAISLSRTCFCSGLISEDEAWEDILRIADIVYEIFDSFEAFHNNYRLGNAYWSNKFDMIKRRRDEFLNYNEFCDWPIKDLPWPSRKNIELSPWMIDGFISEMKNDIEKMGTKPRRENGNNVIKGKNRLLH